MNEVRYLVYGVRKQFVATGLLLLLVNPPTHHHDTGKG